MSHGELSASDWDNPRKDNHVATDRDNHAFRFFSPDSGRGFGPRGRLQPLRNVGACLPHFRGGDVEGQETNMADCRFFCPGLGYPVLPLHDGVAQCFPGHRLFAGGDDRGRVGGPGWRDAASEGSGDHEGGHCL